MLCDIITTYKYLIGNKSEEEQRKNFVFQKMNFIF